MYPFMKALSPLIVSDVRGVAKSAWLFWQEMFLQGEYIEERGTCMLGISDFAIGSAYLLCIASALLCLGYGIFNWNKGQEAEVDEITEELRWEQTEQRIKETL